MKVTNKAKRVAAGVLSLVMLLLLARANSNNGPVSAADQQAQAIDLAGKQEQKKVDLFTGSFGYSIPIACAPARSGSEPNLALAYSSAGDLGWCGMGWDLNTGYIERNTRDGFPIPYSSGSPAMPLNQYDDSKGFVLNLSGKESKLFAVAVNGSQVEYRAEVDTEFLRCYCDTNNNSWTVYDKSGNVYYLGETANTRVTNPKTGWGGYSGTFRWALDQIVTATGDWTTVAYASYTNSNTSQPERIPYPTQITYNGHTNYNGYSANATGTNTITFQTEARANDWRISYRWGFRTEQNRRLTNILCSVGSQKAWSYALKYGVSSATGRSLLTNVVVYGFDANNNASAFLTNTFTYQGNTNGVSFGPTIVWTNLNLNMPGSSSGSYDPEVAQINLTAGLNYTVADLLDMDGDGLPDRVCFDTNSPNQYQVQKNLGMQADGNGSFDINRYAFGYTSTGPGSASDSNLMPDGQAYGALNSPYGRIRDIDGDGLPDRVMDYWKPFDTSVSPNYAPYTNFVVMLNTGSGFLDATLWPVTNLVAPIDAAGAYVTYECVEGGGNVIMGGITNSVGVGLFDLNGDNLPDRVMTTYAPYEAMTNLYVQANTGIDFAQLRRFPYKSQNWNGSLSGQPSYSVSQWAGIETAKSHFIDLNGDGLPDHLMPPMNPASLGNTPSHPYTYYAVEYNDGYSFESTNTYTGVPGSFDRWPVTSPLNGSSIIYNGITFNGDDIWDLPFAGLYDLNGDGLPDRVTIDPATWNTSNIGWLVYLNNGHGFNSNAIHVSGINNQGHTGLTTDSPWWGIQGIGNQGPESDNQITTLIDINGDGLLDRVMAVYYSSSPTANYFLVQLNQGPSPDLLTNVNNGIGGNIGVSYNASTAYDNRVNTGDPNSVSTMPFPHQVVAAMTASDGVNPAQTTTYGYGGGFYDGSRHEFHGFAVVTNTDPTLRSTVTYFHTGGGRNYSSLGEYGDTGKFAKAGMAYRTETYGSDNVLYHLQVNKVDQASLGNSRYFPYVTLSFDYDYPGPKVTATDFNYDTSNGNLTNKIEYGQITNYSVSTYAFTDVTNADTRYYNSHFTAISTYILDHPDKTTLTDKNYNVLRETDYSYNSAGSLTAKLTRIAAGSFATNSYGNYTAYGLVGQTTDPVGVQTAITYDSALNTYPATTTVGGTFATATIYNPRSGALASSTDLMGVTITNSYDSFCRLVESDQIPVGGTAVWMKKYSYPAALLPIVSGAAVNYVDVAANDGLAGGVESRTYIDGFGHAIQTRIQAETGNFRVVSTAYDGRGNAFLTTWPVFGTGASFSKPANGTAASWTGLDAAGRAATNRPVTVTFNTNGAFSSKTDLTGDTGSPLAAKKWSYVNGTDPWWIVCTDEDGQVRKYGLDALGRTNQILEVNGSSTYTNLLKYDLADNLTNLVNANGENIYWAYNDAGGLVAMADPYLGQWIYQRDYANRLRVQTDGRGDVVQLSYVNPATSQQDPLGRVQTKLVYGTNYTAHTLTLYSAVTNNYDSNGGDSAYTVYPGLLYKTVDREGWEKTGYDSRGRATKTVRYLNLNGRAYTNGFAYDDGNNVTSTTYPNGGPTIGYSYFHGGSLGGVSRGSYNYYTNSAASFDEFGHVTNFVYGSGLATAKSYYPASKRLKTISGGPAGAVFTRTFTYSNSDDVATINGTGITGTMSATYDNLHRLKTYSGLSGSYGYDAVGNITTNVEGGGSVYTYNNPRKQAVRSAFGYTNLYDLCGNMMVRHGGLTNAQALTYDPENHLSAIAQAGVFSDEFGYAASGARLWKRINQNPTNIQVWIGNNYEEKGGKVLFHVFAGGQVCTFENGSPLAGGSDTNKVGYYYHEDSLNTSSALSGSSGAQQEVNVYYPFGRTQTASPQASFQVSRRFTGQVFDAESGLYYYNARYYDPELGRFVQPDDIIPNLANPQSWNRYSYVMNNPLRYNDPDGHYGLDAMSGLTAEQQIVTARYAAPPVIGMTVGTLSAGAAAPLFVGAGASTTFAAVGSGMAGGAAGDLTSQALTPGKSFSGQELAASSLAAGALNGAASKIGLLTSKSGKVAEPTPTGVQANEAANAGEIQGPPTATTRVSNRPGNQQSVELNYPDGRKVDINANRVKEWVPTTDPRVKSGTKMVKFENAQPGSKGFKRDPTPQELEIHKNRPQN